jgi:splicing factor 3B subunit 3
MELMHKTELDGIPSAMCPFQGRLLVGIQNSLRIYDLGKRKLLRKCENKQIPNYIVEINTMGDRIVISDVQESVHMARYIFQENKIVVFTDDVKPRWMSKFIILDYNTIAGGDKFGTFFVNRVNQELIDDLQNDNSAQRFLYEKKHLHGAAHRVINALNLVYKNVRISCGRLYIFSA